jgi:UDP-N-acetylmuramoyl-tripeptide--D-alanyl-D-alanine ligase
MKAQDLIELAAVLDADLRHGPEGSVPKTGATGISIDSRTLCPGDLYVAVRGERHDGHAFVTQVLQGGAAGAIVDDRYAQQERPRRGPLLVVRDTLTALGRWAGWLREQSPYTVIGITGSVGKTTTRQMIAHVLGQQQRVWQSPKNYNNLIGLPLTLLSAPDGTESVVAELGTNRPGEIAQLTRIARPDIAVVTLAAPAHLEGLGTMESIVREKLSIHTGLKNGGPLMVNGDCPALMQGCRRLDLAPVTYGLHPRARIRAVDVTYQSDRSTFRVDDTRVTIPQPGPAHVLNALACWAVCRHLDIDPEAIAAGLALLPPVTMRNERLQIGTLTVLNDCYNASPAAMVNALQTLALLDPEGRRRRVFVCGPMLELGAHSERLHRELGSAIVDAGVDLVLAAGPLAAQAARAAQTLRPAIGICRYRDGDALCASLLDKIREQDMILVKGSRSARLEQAVALLREHFTPNLSLMATNE